MDRWKVQHYMKCKVGKLWFHYRVGLNCGLCEISKKKKCDILFNLLL